MSDFLRYSRLQNLLRMSGYVTEIPMFACYVIVHPQAKMQFPRLSP